MVGFGMIWIPIIITPIGPVLSFIWIIVNAMLCLYFSYKIDPINKITFLLIIIGALGLSIITEGKATYALAIVGIVGLIISYKKYAI